MNPLGVRALYLGSSFYRIHGTDAPWTIGTAASKGCIRMYNKDVLDLYPRVPRGTRVTVTWERFRSEEISQTPVATRRGSRSLGGPRLRNMQSNELPRQAVESWAN
ncbi:L,D-transpeptidase [Hyphomicrobium sp. D-2]|uniref:L,D-transpeptidase n=1 Tax=Hyphomicrobium sp. D-2 TaxID=3041621 RepID=UPI0024589806|nr:L,D-transpeptidase [Hyphomicrobium sp. D-2]MDH4982288.1 L,D-transpeptidase [Hyphomicrobium sp. D-2]